jgi:hypothetical protein
MEWWTVKLQPQAASYKLQATSKKLKLETAT